MKNHGLTSSDKQMAKNISRQSTPGNVHDDKVGIMPVILRPDAEVRTKTAPAFGLLKDNENQIFKNSKKNMRATHKNCEMLSELPDKWENRYERTEKETLSQKRINKPQKVFHENSTIDREINRDCLEKGSSNICGKKVLKFSAIPLGMVKEKNFNIIGLLNADESERNMNLSSDEPTQINLNQGNRIFCLLDYDSNYNDSSQKNENSKNKCDWNKNMEITAPNSPENPNNRTATSPPKKQSRKHSKNNKTPLRSCNTHSFVPLKQSIFRQFTRTHDDAPLFDSTFSQNGNIETSFDCMITFKNPSEKLWSPTQTRVDGDFDDSIFNESPRASQQTVKPALFDSLNEIDFHGCGIGVFFAKPKTASVEDDAFENRKMISKFKDSVYKGLSQFLIILKPIVECKAKILTKVGELRSSCSKLQSDNSEHPIPSPASCKQTNGGTKIRYLINPQSPKAKDQSRKRESAGGLVASPQHDVNNRCLYNTDSQVLKMKVRQDFFKCAAKDFSDCLLSKNDSKGFALTRSGEKPSKSSFYER